MSIRTRATKIYQDILCKTLLKEKKSVGVRNGVYAGPNSQSFQSQRKAYSTGIERQKEDICIRYRTKLGDVNRGNNRKQQVITAAIVGKHSTGNCSQYGKWETVEHVLTVCRRYETERIYRVTGLKRPG